MIQQGHLYTGHLGQKVIAMETRESGPVRCLVDLQSLYPRLESLYADKLQPAPMRYFGGETPRGAA